MKIKISIFLVITFFVFFSASIVNAVDKTPDIIQSQERQPLQRQTPSSSLQQPTEQIQLTPDKADKLKADIARWRSLKALYLADIEVIGWRPSHKSLAMQARTNVSEVDTALAEVETLIKKERFDRERLSVLEKRLEGIVQDSRSIIRGLLVIYREFHIPQVTGGFVELDDCNTHAGYDTAAQCRYCSSRPKDDCMCMSGSCKCYCDNNCNCGDLSVFDSADNSYKLKQLHAMCAELCYANKELAGQNWTET